MVFFHFLIMENKIESIVDEKGNHYVINSYMDIEKVENIEKI